MNRMLALAAVLAAGCSGVKDDRPGCARSADCPAGEYCASTPDGAVCWPDAQPPAVSGVAVTCGPPCLRDGTLRVEATVADDREVGEVAVALDLDPSRAVPMARVGARWVAQVPLEGFPFPAFERAVVATVTARDGARNTASASADAGQQPMVTRLRWTYDAGVPMTSPAVLDDGTVVVGLSATSSQLLAISADGSKRWAATVGSRFLTSPPSVAADGIWVAVTGGALSRVGFDGTPSSSVCASGELLSGPASIVAGKAVIGSLSGVMALAAADGACNQSATTGTIEAPPVTSTSGHVLVASADILLSYTVLANGVLRPDWTGISPAPLPPNIGDSVTAPLAIDASGSVWTIGKNGALSRTASDASTTPVTILPAGSAGPVILADGSVVVGSRTGTLSRVMFEGTPVWSESEPVDGAPSVPLALAGSRALLVVPTGSGFLYAIDAADGHIAWATKLSPTGDALQPANVHGAPGAATSTAYVAGADGKLYAVIVDGQLDRAAPWPKAFHDPRNTGNAGALP